MPPKKNSGPNWKKSYTEFLRNDFQRFVNKNDERAICDPHLNGPEDQLDDIYSLLIAPPDDSGYEDNPFCNTPNKVFKEKFKIKYKELANEFIDIQTFTVQGEGGGDGPAVERAPDPEGTIGLTSGSASVGGKPCMWVAAAYDVCGMNNDVGSMVHVAALLPSGYHPRDEGKDVWYEIVDGGKTLRLTFSLGGGGFSTDILDLPCFNGVYARTMAGYHSAVTSLEKSLANLGDDRGTQPQTFDIPLPISCSEVVTLLGNSVAQLNEPLVSRIVCQCQNFIIFTS